jgi:hypothetical protein
VGGGILDRLEGGYVGFFVAVAATPELGVQGRKDAARVAEALQPWSSGHRFSNFTEEAVEPDTLFAPDALARLRAIRAAVDPSGMFVANHAL